MTHEECGSKDRIKAIEKEVEGIKTEVKGLYKKFDNIAWMRETLTKLNTIMDVMVEENKKRDTKDEQFTITINNINENLIKLHNDNTIIHKDIKETQERIHQVELEQKQNASKGKLDVINIVTTAVTSLITTGIVGGITWLIFNSLK